MLRQITVMERRHAVNSVDADPYVEWRGVSRTLGQVVRRGIFRSLDLGRYSFFLQPP
jgi:hypothetical protein